jgi:hypothetical protein
VKKLFSTFFLTACVLVFSLPAISQSCTSSVCNAASPNQSDVLAALPSSSNSNASVVVNIPAGAASWTSSINYRVPTGVTNLTIQGKTSINWTGTPGTSSYGYSVNDATVIQDTYQSTNSLMVLNVGGSSTSLRITGLTVQGGNIGGSYSKYNGWIQILSGTAQVRLDHNHFNAETYNPVNTPVAFRAFSPVTGVADHNVFDLANNNSSYPFAISIFGAYGDSIGNGDGTFSRATAWGSGSSFYVEANASNGGVIDDCGNAGAMVIRYNTINDASVGIQTHGTKTPAGPQRGCRLLEAYHNYFTGPGGGSQASAAVGTKGATAVFWGNTMASGYYRFYQGGGDRQSGDETETNTPNGWGYCGTSVNGNGVGSGWDGNQSNTGYPCLDGIGRGQDLQALNGADFPSRLNSATHSIAWSHQYLEPQYLWMNSIGSATYMLLNDGSQNNQDFYYDCGSGNNTCSGGFTGTAGTGYGTLAARPSTCTAGQGGTYFTSPTGSYGVAYFATDANGGDGELYVCSATNTWTGIYRPYTYPHPLLGGTTKTSTAPPAPTGLVSTVY